MFRALRRKPTEETKRNEIEREPQLPFLNRTGREEGLQADRDFRANILTPFKAVPVSPVSKIARKLDAIPPALKSLSDAKGSDEKAKVVQTLAFKKDALDSAVQSFLKNRMIELEEEEKEEASRKNIAV